MSTVISVYTNNVYKEFQLPAVPNADYNLSLIHI